MRPSDKLIEWFNTQNKQIVDTIAFQTLHAAPDFDLAEHSEIENTCKVLERYLKDENTGVKIVGKLLYVKSAIDFYIRKYDDIDELIDGQIMNKSAIEQGESEGYNMEYLKKVHEEGEERFNSRKEFKENWIQFCDSYFNFEILDQLMLDDFLNRKR